MEISVNIMWFAALAVIVTPFVVYHLMGVKMKDDCDSIGHLVAALVTLIVWLVIACIALFWYAGRA